MKLYLDSADVNAWNEWLPKGLFFGITTNPLLAQRAGLSYQKINWSDMAARAKELGAKELHIQVVGHSDSYVDFSNSLYEIGRANEIEIVIKLPLIESAIQKATDIQKLGGRILMTACYDAKQMFIAKALGADFIAPYYGRMLEKGIDANAHLATMATLNSDGHKCCTLLIASLRSTDQMVELASQGHDTFTISPNIASELIVSDLSLNAFEEFEAAALSG